VIDFPLEKCFLYISQKALKQQLFPKMAAIGNVEMPESSSPTPTTTARKFWPKGFKIGLFLKQAYVSKRYLEGFSRYLEMFECRI